MTVPSSFISILSFCFTVSKNSFPKQSIQMISLFCQTFDNTIPLAASESIGYENKKARGLICIEHTV